MLARLAENLFWAGRYLERAEDTTRLVDVTYHTLLEAREGEVERSWEQLLEMLHLEEAYGEAPIHPHEVVRFLVLERAQPSSIIASVASARENIRSVRELVSSELWQAVNELHLLLRSRDHYEELADQPFQLFDDIRRMCMTVAGVSAETMPRDEGWQFMMLGRMLERAEMTCRLIDVRYAQLAVIETTSRTSAPIDADVTGGAHREDLHQWVALLKSASAFEAYRRRYRSSMDPADVVEFLLLEEDLPRSVLYSLTEAMALLEALTDGRASRAARLLGLAASSLRYRDIGELFAEGLHDHLDDMQRRVGHVAEAVANEFFRHAPVGTMHAIAQG
ncbi:MAG: alpha-E domain-containing protein [Nitriliruptoraceae bacterium]